MSAGKNRGETIAFIGSQWHRMMVGLCALLVVGDVHGQAAVDTPSVPVTPTAVVPPAGPLPIRSKADRVNYNDKTGWLQATGNVTIRRGTTVLQADRVRINMRTADGEAWGNVVLTQPDKTVRLKHWKGNLKDTREGSDAGKGRGTFTGLTFDAKPFRLLHSDTARHEGEHYVIRHADVTSCSNEVDHVHYSVAAREVEVVPDDYMKVWGATFYVGPVPIFYLPYWRRDLSRNLGFRFYPGHSSRMGAFLLSSYRYRVHPNVTAETHLDYRAKRGVAVGQDLRWKDHLERWQGELNAYYVDDEDPWDENEDPETSPIESTRYRIYLEHAVVPSENDYFYLRGQYLSDKDVLEDFFEDEYRAEREPDNYASYVHREDAYVFGLLLRSRLNDFYSTINRLPEVSLDLPRQQIGQSRYYYDGRTAASSLERVYAEGSSRDDYSAVRVDSAHALYRPQRHMGWLNVIPRAGYQATYYSETLSHEVVTEPFSEVQTNTTVAANGMTNTSVMTLSGTRTVTNEVAAEAALRSRFQLGLEASFRAFKLISNDPAFPLRHVVEPYADYTLVPEPNVTPDELYQFDRIDRLGKEHSVQLGIRNKLQTKRNAGLVDLIDLDVYTEVNLEPEEGEDNLESLSLDMELRWEEWFALDMDAEYDFEEGRLDNLDTQITFRHGDYWILGTEYRFRYDRSSLISANLSILPQAPWGLMVGGRYEGEAGELEEVSAAIQRRLDCMVWRVGGFMRPGYTTSSGFEEEDEWRVVFEFWLTAFPEYSIATKRRS